MTEWCYAVRRTVHGHDDDDDHDDDDHDDDYYYGNVLLLCRPSGRANDAYECHGLLRREHLFHSDDRDRRCSSVHLCRDRANGRARDRLRK